MSEPLGYLITFRTYGTWLHGDEGAVDMRHNAYGTPTLPETPKFVAAAGRLMSEVVFRLERPQRLIVLQTVIEVCAHRKWELHAAHVRTTHVHAVITAGHAPERIWSDLKAYGTRRLKESGTVGGRKHFWADGGSNPYLWDELALVDAIDYVLERQDGYMERYPPARSEPEA